MKNEKHPLETINDWLDERGLAVLDNVTGTPVYDEPYVSQNLIIALSHRGWLKADYDKLSGPLLEEILDEVCISAEDERMVAWRMTRHQSKVDVPIAEGDEILFEMISDGAGPQRVSLSEGRICYYAVSVSHMLLRSSFPAQGSAAAQENGDRQDVLSKVKRLTDWFSATKINKRLTRESVCRKRGLYEQF